MMPIEFKEQNVIFAKNQQNVGGVMDITRMSAAELAEHLAEQIKFGNAVEFIRQCVKDSQKDLWELIDGAEPIISTWGTESPGQVKFKEMWLARARKARASVEGKDNHVA